MRHKVLKTEYLIVGLGAAGGVLFGKLAEAGRQVIGIDAGPYWNPEHDFVSDEREMEKLKWNDPRISQGSDPLDIGTGSSGKGVGGGTTHYTMMSLRLHPSDFHVYSQDGVASDWPISYDDLEPFYTEVENDLPVSGPDDFPWVSRNKPYPMPAHDQSCVDRLFRKGAEKLGIKVVSCPLALITEPLSGRQPCINRGFCEQGCKPNAKSSTLITYIPRGLKAGGIMMDNTMATRINMHKNETSVKSVTCVNTHTKEKFEIECQCLILAAFSIETPRLLFLSRTDKHPQGIANSSGLVGKKLMCHLDHVVYAKFDEPLRIYHNPPVTSITQDFYETRAENDFVRGFSIAPYCGRPIGFAIGAIGGRSDLWGKKLVDFMKEYNFWLQLGIIGETLPYKHNCVELSVEKDDLGLPIPKTHYAFGENEKKMLTAGYEKMEEIITAAGSTETFRSPLMVHLMGTTCMGNSPEKSVVDKDLKSHDVDNLYICGASVFPTSGAVNPTLTIQALAARLASHLGA